MPRKILSPEDRRKSISFTTTGHNVEKLDKYVEEETIKNPLALISRQTILEWLLIEFLYGKK